MVLFYIQWSCHRFRRLRLGLWTLISHQQGAQITQITGYLYLMLFKSLVMFRNWKWTTHTIAEYLKYHVLVLNVMYVICFHLRYKECGQKRWIHAFVLSGTSVMRLHELYIKGFVHPTIMIGLRTGFCGSRVQYPCALLQSIHAWHCTGASWGGSAMETHSWSSALLSMIFSFMSETL